MKKIYFTLPSLFLRILSSLVWLSFLPLVSLLSVASSSSLTPFLYLMEQVDREINYDQTLVKTLSYIDTQQHPQYFSHLYFLLSENRKYLFSAVDDQGKFSSAEFAQSLHWDIESFTDVGSWNFLKGSEDRAEKFDEYMFMGKSILEVSTEQYEQWDTQSSVLKSEISSLKKEYSALQKQLPILIENNAPSDELSALKNQINAVALQQVEKENSRIEILQHQKKLKPQISLLQEDLSDAEQYKDALIKEVYLEEVFGK